MGGKGTRTYEHEGQTYSFDFDMFYEAFRNWARSNGMTFAKLEETLGEEVGVSKSAVHQWYGRINAPGSLELVASLASALDLELMDLLCVKKEEEAVAKLDEHQREAVARAYRAIADFLNLFEQTDGFAWKKYQVQPGSVFCRFVSPWVRSRVGEYTKTYDDGLDLAMEAWDGVLHTLRREWIGLGSHPVYNELEEFIDGTLFDMFNGKTNSSHWFHPGESASEPAEHTWVESARVLKECRGIIARYL